MPRSRATKRSGHHVDVLQEGAEDAGDGGGRERPRVHFGNRALVLDADALDRRFRELSDERTELLGERHEGPQARRFLGGDRREVDRVLNRALQQIVRHLLGDLEGDILLRFRRRCAEMRRADDIGMAEERICRGGLLEKTSKAAPATWPESRAWRRACLVDEAAAGAVDDANALLGLGDVFGRQHVPRLLRHRHVQRDDVGAAQKVLELDLFHAEFERPLGREERVVGDDASCAVRWHGRRRSSRCCRNR